MSDRNDDELEELFISDDLTAEDYEELQMHCMLEAELSDSDDLLKGIMSDLKSTKKTPKPKRNNGLRKVKKRPSPLRWLLPACACLLIGGFFYLDQFKALFGDKALVLKSGAKVELRQGAEYKILGDNALQLDSGGMLATVPKKAVGFTVKTPQGTIVDLSTKFDVQTIADKTIVKVLEGKVEVAKNEGDGLVIYGGESSTISSGGSEPSIDTPALKAESLVVNLNFGQVTVGNNNVALFDGHWNNSINYPASKMHNSLKKPIEMDLTLSHEKFYQLKDQLLSRIFDGCLFSSWNSEEPIDELIVRKSLFPQITGVL